MEHTSETSDVTVRRKVANEQAFDGRSSSALIALAYADNQSFSAEEKHAHALSEAARQRFARKVAARSSFVAHSRSAQRWRSSYIGLNMTLTE